jgi:hypothetical protein
MDAHTAELGRQVITAERLFGTGSVQHERAIAAWLRATGQTR